MESCETVKTILNVFQKSLKHCDFNIARVKSKVAGSNSRPWSWHSFSLTLPTDALEARSAILVPRLTELKQKHHKTFTTQLLANTALFIPLLFLFEVYRSTTSTRSQGTRTKKCTSIHNKLAAIVKST
jgi:hypothetical protein